MTEFQLEFWFPPLPKYGTDQLGKVSNLYMPHSKKHYIFVFKN